MSWVLCSPVVGIHICRPVLWLSFLERLAGIAFPVLASRAKVIIIHVVMMSRAAFPTGAEGSCRDIPIVDLIPRLVLDVFDLRRRDGDATCGSTRI